MASYKFTIIAEGESPDEAWDDFIADVIGNNDGFVGVGKPEYDQVEQVFD